MSLRVIGFSGRKGAGKDWAAGYFQLKSAKYVGYIEDFSFSDGGTFQIIEGGWRKNIFFDYTDQEFRKNISKWEKYTKRFSSGDILKNHLVSLFDLPVDKLWGSQSVKEEKCGIDWAIIPEYPEQLRGTGEMTYREIMQAWAEVVRHVDKHAWIRANAKEILHYGRGFHSNGRVALIADIRYVDEIEYLRDWGRKWNVDVEFVRLTRKIEDDPHISEVSLNNYGDFDYIIDNANMNHKQFAEELDKVWNNVH